MAGLLMAKDRSQIRRQLQMADLLDAKLLRCLNLLPQTMPTERVKDMAAIVMKSEKATRFLNMAVEEQREAVPLGVICAMKRSYTFIKRRLIHGYS